MMIDNGLLVILIMKKILVLIVAAFVIFCGGLVVKSGFFKNVSAKGSPCILLQQTQPVDKAEAKAPAVSKETPVLKAVVVFGADQSPVKDVKLGSVDPCSNYEFQLDLTSQGAAIRSATFSKFDNRSAKNPQPLTVLSPAGQDVLSMANREFIFTQQGQQLALNKLSWECSDVNKTADGSQTAGFEAIIINKDTDKPVLKLIKTYKISPNSYSVNISLKVENLSFDEQKVRFNLAGPVGIGEEDQRADSRKVIAAFKGASEIRTTRFDMKGLEKAPTPKGLALTSKNNDIFIWAGIVNKYFASILIPVPDNGKNFCDWIEDKTGRFYNPSGKPDSEDKTIGLDFEISPVTLAVSDQPQSSKVYNFALYIGPKDKRVFDGNPMYKSLGFEQTIDFMACLLPHCDYKSAGFWHTGRDGMDVPPYYS